MKCAKDTLAAAVVRYYSHYPDTLRDDIQHTQEVVSFTRMIAVGEGLSSAEVELLECAAWLHDIGCPRSKEIYGNSLPAHQQEVGREVSAELLASFEEFTTEQQAWLVDVVGTHHQFKSAQELHFQPLFEADLIVNLLSGYHPREKAAHLYRTLMCTESGKALFAQVIGVE